MFIASLNNPLRMSADLPLVLPYLPLFMHCFAYLLFLASSALPLSTAVGSQTSLSAFYHLVLSLFKSYLFNVILIPCSLHRPFIQAKLKKEIFSASVSWAWLKLHTVPKVHSRVGWSNSLYLCSEGYIDLNQGWNISYPVTEAFRGKRVQVNAGWWLS
jgi:hypothetical protein